MINKKKKYPRYFILANSDDAITYTDWKIILFIKVKTQGGKYFHVYKNGVESECTGEEACDATVERGVFREITEEEACLL